MHNNYETFNFLKEDFPTIEKICTLVEQNIYINPVYAIIEGRKATEKILDEVIDEENLQKLKKINLNDKIEELFSFGIFSTDRFVFRALDENRRLGNIAAHDEVRDEIMTALKVHKNLYSITKWFHEKYFDKYEVEEYKNPSPQHIETKSKLVEEDVSIDTISIDDDRHNYPKSLPSDSVSCKNKDSYLLGAISKLKISAREAIEDPKDFSIFKKYLHVKREIEKEFISVLEESTKNDFSQLILLCGSVGDGKSHLLAAVNEDYNELFSKFEIHNDATESSNPNKTSIDTLSEVLINFKDKNIKTSNTKLIVAINLGVLSKFSESEYANEEFTTIKDELEKSNVFNSEKINEKFESEYIKIVDFNDYNLFELDPIKNGENPNSTYISKLFKKISNKDDENPFYTAYLKDKENKLNTPVLVNYEIFSDDEVQKKLIQFIIKIIVKHKKILSTREILNFIYEIIVPPKINSFYSENVLEFQEDLLPNLVFTPYERSDLLELISLEDPKKFRSEILDQVLIDWNNISRNNTNNNSNVLDIVCKYLDSSKIGVIINSLSDYNQSKEELLKTFLNFAIFYGKNFKNTFNDESFEKYLEYLYYFNTNDILKYKELYDNIKKTIYKWNGSYDEKYIIMSKLNNFIISKRIELKPKPTKTKNNNTIENLGSKFKKNISLVFSINGIELDLNLDYPLYDMIMKINNGYQPNVTEKKKLLIFDEFIEKLSNAHINDSLIITDSYDTQYKFEKDDFDLFNFKRMV
ncbi:type I restriction enzyme EcoKI subunit R [Methanobrevibacter cuticularis]|uniref:Type I restriction enzyme EcoKI subunit R n=1 Tax=Methanobrevibacter cuticularis TaxID=47311 RepID=A0A166D107_9EURY|nr:DNA phosphorothioation-dependent restriction protein DptF [Methanobrevibacter cuticularis]KZX15089.1 type I restriction enzyme EcoKI subunit R [Methanobrevibacter cuticularis]